MGEGQIFMIPCPIEEGGLDTIPKDTLSALYNLTHFVVERSKTARAFLKLVKHPTPQNEFVLFELDKNNPESGLYTFLKKTSQSFSIGVISEAGCPGVADPGALIVSWAHKNNIKVSPMVGPSSILLALMASGFSGQSFCFHGYLPIKKDELPAKLRQLESLVHKRGQTQIFMETPYRNNGMLQSLLKYLSPNTNLCIAKSITSEEEWIKTATIAKWKSIKIDLHKKPCIFLLGKN